MKTLIAFTYSLRKPRNQKLYLPFIIGAKVRKLYLSSIFFLLITLSTGVLSVLGIEVEEEGGILPKDIFTVEMKEVEKDDVEDEAEQEEEEQE